MKLLNIFAVLQLSFNLGLSAQSVPPRDGSEALRNTAEKLAAQISERPRIKDLFDASFFKFLPLEKTEEILRQIYRVNGKVTAVKLNYTDPDGSGHFNFETEKGFILPVTLNINKATGRVTGLLFKIAIPKDLTLADLKAKLSALPGKTGFLLRKLNNPGRTLETLNENDYFAVGSAFKLYVLGAIVEEDYSWKKIIYLKEESKSLPSGRLQAWPDGSPLTLHTLAAAMISESDNTAADAIVDGLGRDTIEDALGDLGHSKPELLKPFLKTSEMFRLKSDTGASVEYLNAGLKEKYMRLRDLARKPLNAADVKAAPFGINRIEWPASPADLCRLMDYFRKEEDKPALDIMAINPGLDIPRGKFFYAGYKGGSEPGVLNMTWLFKTSRADWYCLTGSWNDEKNTLDEAQFSALMQAAINMIGEFN
ncbi:MAG: class A beta-lactamase-related serine hydrolase [Elusimicrobia bacterium]|nr:class A beta-lactamase-related serine hydrolase [Elusimicrobiota bacterium]